jgi:hypothetical protein
MASLLTRSLAVVATAFGGILDALDQTYDIMSLVSVQMGCL